LLGHTLDDGRSLSIYVRDNEPVEVQTAALRAMTRRNTAEAANLLLSEQRWRSYPPGLRLAVLDSLLGRAKSHGAVLDAMEAGTVQPGVIPTARRQQLLESKDEVIRARASKLFSKASGAERQKAYEEAKACLSLNAKPENGREVFKRACASCHRLDREGFAVGPDLFDIRNQPKESILLHIIIPEQEIAANFTAYTCETRDGRTITGLLVADTPAGVTLRQAQGVEESVTRATLYRWPPARCPSCRRNSRRR
jgi:putative heme-binding domain-containing protein